MAPDHVTGEVALLMGFFANSPHFELRRCSLAENSRCWHWRRSSHDSRNPSQESWRTTDKHARLHHTAVPHCGLYVTTIRSVDIDATLKEAGKLLEREGPGASLSEMGHGISAS
jgi:hypothetical protein